MWSNCLRRWHGTDRSTYPPIGTSGLCMSPKKTSFLEGGWACSGERGFDFFCFYAWFRSPPITITVSATRCSFLLKLFLCGSGKPHVQFVAETSVTTGHYFIDGFCVRRPSSRHTK